VGRAAGRIEKLGIPTVGIVRGDFVSVMKNAIAGMGFPPEMAFVPVPMALFLPGSDLAPVAQNLDQVVAGLTRWQPTVTAKSVIKPPTVRVEGKNYEEALAAVHALFLKNLWGDGLPLMPPTPERVRWILRGTDLAPETVIGKILPEGRIATAETLACALAMAGGRPEYLPVLISAVQALIDKNTNHQAWQATSASVFPTVIVNGPIARQIRLNSGFGLMGPDPLHPAGGCIGRALRLLMQNVGGARPGVGTLAQYGGMRYTNAVFAEDEDGLPRTWRPLNAEHFGLREGTSSVALVPVSGIANILGGGGSGSPDQLARQKLYRLAAFMALPNDNMLTGYEEGTPGILIFSSVTAREFADAGWSKEKIKQFLFENARIPVSRIRRDGFDGRIELKNLTPTLKQDPWPITARAENFMIVVAGGRHPGHAYWMQAAQGPKPVGADIRLPAKWRDLLAEAEKELGPIP
jgi:hypothetical protein